MIRLLENSLTYKQLFVRGDFDLLFLLALWENRLFFIEAPVFFVMIERKEFEGRFLCN